MTETIPLRAVLGKAAADLNRVEPPAHLRQRVLDAAAAPGAPGAPAQPRTWALAWGGGAAFAAVLVGSAVLMLRHPAAEAPAEDMRSDRFVPLVSADRWPREPSQAWLVSTEMPRERLAALGLPFDPARAGDSVRAELLVRASGEVLAVRFDR